MFKNLIGRSDSSDFNHPILSFPGYDKVPWRLEDAVKGTQIFGATGSGKSSGSGKDIAKAFLKAGYGGLVLCAKPDERKQWEEYAEKTGRLGDLVVFKPSSGLSFNPLAYESSRVGGGETINLVELIMRLQELSENFSAQGGGGQDEKFWVNAMKRYVSRLIDLLKIAEQEVSFSNIYELMISSNAQSMQDYANYQEQLLALSNIENDAKEFEDDEATAYSEEATKEYEKEYDILLNSSFCILCLEIAKERASGEDEKFNQTLFMVEQYFTHELLGLPEKTRSIIEEYLRGIVEPFLGGILNDYFSKGVDSNLYPEVTYEQNKIILLDFPVKTHLLAGVMAQGIYKYLWQQAMERRDTEQNNKPVFLWVDESQYFINPMHDTLFQTTARSARVCTVYLTQNINNYYFVMGSNQPQARAKSLIANLSTLIFHANSDFDTNDWASKTIGQGYHRQETQSRNATGVTINESFVKDYNVPSSIFTKLKTGGSDRKVEGVILVNGKNWGDPNINFIRTIFIQDKRK